MVMANSTVGSLTATTLVHTCTIETRQQASEGGEPQYDSLGEIVTTAYGPGASGVSCFARQRGGAGTTEDEGRGFVGQVWQVRLPRGTAIGNDDAIADVRDASGVSIVDGPLTVVDLHHRAGHILALCEASALSGPVSVEDAP